MIETKVTWRRSHLTPAPQRGSPAGLSKSCLGASEIEKSLFFPPLTISPTENTACAVAVGARCLQQPPERRSPLCLAALLGEHCPELPCQGRLCGDPSASTHPPRSSPSKGALCLPHGHPQRPQSVPRVLLLRWLRASNIPGYSRCA